VLITILCHRSCGQSKNSGDWGSQGHQQCNHLMEFS